MEKLHIVLTGRRNSGKSSLINTLTGQQTAIVSDVPGTTTDPVKKSFEIPGFASVVFIDTAGIDDTGTLGRERVKKTLKTFLQADVAFLLISENRFGKEEENLIGKFNSIRLPFLILHTKTDLHPLSPVLRTQLEEKYKVPVIDICTSDPGVTSVLLNHLRRITDKSSPAALLEGLAYPGDILLLVAPVDSEVPVGRLILPQVQTIRAALDRHASCIVLQPEEIKNFLDTTRIRPRLVITDSQAFSQVAAVLPESVPLTGFSILLARQKGCFEAYLKGTRRIDTLQDDDTVLLLESCSHHVSCEDIGRVKIPALLRKYTGKKLNFEYISGLDSIEKPLTNYALVIQCGGCMITATQLRNRLLPFIEAGIPVSNYGMTLAFLTGIFDRALRPFRDR